jgi:hypothetical protein
MGMGERNYLQSEAWNVRGIALGHILDAADGIRKLKKLQRAKCGLQNRVAERIVAGDGNF